MSEHIKLDQGKLQITCGSCGKVNGVSVERIGDKPICGSCKTSLSYPDEPLEVTDDSFDELINHSPIPVLVDFWAPWCGPCRMMGPVLENLAKKKIGTLLVAKLNTDQSPTTPGKFGIQGIPTIIFFKNGKESGRVVGAVPESRLESLISS